MRDPIIRQREAQILSLVRILAENAGRWLTATRLADLYMQDEGQKISVQKTLSLLSIINALDLLDGRRSTYKRTERISYRLRIGSDYTPGMEEIPVQIVDAAQKNDLED